MLFAFKKSVEKYFKEWQEINQCRVWQCFLFLFLAGGTCVSNDADFIHWLLLCLRLVYV